MLLRRTAALAATGALALGGAALLVPSSADATPKTDHANRQQLRTTGHTTITVQRGRVTAVSPTSISLTSKDGYAHTYAITAKTKVKQHRVAVALSGLKVGAPAQVIADADTARRITFLKPKTGQHA